MPAGFPDNNIKFTSDLNVPTPHVLNPSAMPFYPHNSKSSCDSSESEISFSQDSHSPNPIKVSNVLNIIHSNLYQQKYSHVMWKNGIKIEDNIIIEIQILFQNA